MSVYKSRRKDASAQFIADARELRRMTARAVKRFPSSYRYIVTNGLLEMAREIVVNSVKGNAVYLHKDLSQGDFDLRHRYLKRSGGIPYVKRNLLLHRPRHPYNRH